MLKLNVRTELSTPEVVVHNRPLAEYMSMKHEPSVKSSWGLGRCCKLPSRSMGELWWGAQLAKPLLAFDFFCFLTSKTHKNSLKYHSKILLLAQQSIFSWLIHQLLAVYNTTWSRTSNPVAVVVGQLKLLRDFYSWKCYTHTEVPADKMQKGKSAKMHLQAKWTKWVLSFAPTNYQRMNRQDCHSER